MVTIDWAEFLASSTSFIILACVIVTVTVILIYAVKAKNKVIDFFWTGLLILGIGLAFRFGLLELIPEFPDNPILDVAIYVIRWVVSMFGMILIARPTKMVVGKLQDLRANWNPSKS